MSSSLGPAGRAAAWALAAGGALAMMETASILSQPGAAVASLADLAVLLTWLALPYAAALLVFGGAVGLPLARVAGFAAAFNAAAWGAAALIWIRPLSRLGEERLGQGVLQVLLVGVAAAAGVSMGRLSRTASGARWVGAGLAGLGLMVVLSRSVPGPFGHPAPPPHLALRLALSAALAAAVMAVWSVAARRAPAWARAASWARRLGAAGIVVWAAVAAADFTGSIHRAPAVGAAPPAPQAGDPGRPNIILISIDTLRADHLSCYGHPKPTSPAIDRLAAEGVLFEQTASTASFTLPAHASMMTGLFPASHGATYQNRDSRSFTVRGMGPEYPTLAGILAERGYETAGFVSGPLMSREFGFARGFHLYDDRYDRLRSARARLLSRSQLFRLMMRAGFFTSRDLDSQRIAEEVNDRVESWLRREDRPARPYFLFVHYWDPHGPYDPPAPWGLREDGSRIHADYDMDRLLTGDYTLTPRALADTLALYDGEIAYLDSKVGDLIEMLRRDGALDKSLLIFTADHGESFGEHGHWEHSRVLYEDLLRVPFIVRLPGGRAGGTVVREVIAQPTDILPMALAAAGVPVPEGIEGRDLTPWIGAPSLPDIAASGVKAPGLAFAEVDRNVDWPKRWGARYDRDLDSARTLRWKYIRSSTGAEELYDLLRDPGETDNLVLSEPDTAATLRALTQAWRRSLRAASGEGLDQEIDEGLKENLRSLGYIQ